MKTFLTLLSLMLLSLSPASAQAPATTVPEELKAPFEVLQKVYPKFEARRSPKAPADTVWMFRADQAAHGTVEVGFQKSEVVYMIFRKGTGGASWKPEEIFRLHLHFHQDLLHETYSPSTGFSKYNHSIGKQINAGLVTRKDFDPKALMGAL